MTSVVTEMKRRAAVSWLVVVNNDNDDGVEVVDDERHR